MHDTSTKRKRYENKYIYRNKQQQQNEDDINEKITKLISHRHRKLSVDDLADDLADDLVNDLVDDLVDDFQWMNTLAFQQHLEATK